jgi:outer membrane lipoprotein SlyB
VKHFTYALAGAAIGSIAFALLTGVIYASSIKGGELARARQTVNKKLPTIAAFGAIAGGILGLNIAAWMDRR